ncbi:MAG: DsbA family protein [Burkholderiales bacterium]
MKLKRRHGAAWQWLNRDLERWAARYGAAFRHNPHFPINALALMRGAAGVQMRAPDFPKYVETVFHAMWAEPRNLGEPREPANAGGVSFSPVLH